MKKFLPSNLALIGDILLFLFAFIGILIFKILSTSQLRQNGLKISLNEGFEVHRGAYVSCCHGYD